MPFFSSHSLLFVPAFSILASLATAVPHYASTYASEKVVPRQSCTNSASDRSCWGEYDLSTNYYDVVPDTGVTREFWFELTNTTAAPDGVSRDVLTVNGTIPGPTIEVNWGDNVIVHVANNLANNGSSLHFHGIRQNWTNPSDGVASITQCPNAPGDTMTYTWRATQYGSSWYHSHYSLQAWDGVFGGIVIHGPASANYDVDLGALFIQDWDHSTADSLLLDAEINGPPTLDTGLINGTNMWDGEGTYYEQTFDSGSSYLIRLVNTAIDTFFKFSIDNHTFTVIANDFVPIVPYTTDIISIGIGERYDIIVNATEAIDNYWLRAIPQVTCSVNDNVDGIVGIIRYDSSSTADPTTTAYSYDDSCDDEPLASLVPYLALDVGAEGFEEDLAVAVVEDGDTDIFLWEIGPSWMNVSMSNPTLLQVVNGDVTTSNQSNLYELNEANEWAYLIVETTNTQPHPMHLHGHDFYVLAQGLGTYASAAPTLQLTNPPRRDVVMLPGAGYVVMAWVTDNPGVWLCHCHIGWHQSEGLDLQFLEMQADIPSIVDATALNDTCATWDAYLLVDPVVEEEDASGVFDSGV